MLLLTCAAVLVGLLVSLPNATATSVTSRVSPSADAYVSQARPRVNFGSAKELLAGSRPKVRRSYLCFDLADLSGTVVKATLRLYSKDTSRTGFAVHAVSDNSWSEQTITYRTAPAPGPVVATTPRAAADTFTSVDVTGLVAAGGVVSLAVTATDRLRVASRESGAFAPQLIVEVTSTSSSTSTSTSTSTTTSTTTTTTLVQTTTTTTTTTLPPQPAVSAKLVPREGAWWGEYHTWDAALYTSRETLVGRKFDIAKFYVDWDAVFPGSEGAGLRDSGHILFYGWETQIFNTGTRTCWSDIAAGVHDAYIDARIADIKAFGKPLFMSFETEPEANIGVCNRATKGGTAAEYVAAYRHVHDRFRAKGVTNVVWVVHWMGWSGHYTLYPQIWPGDDYVDWVGWDPYNWYTCHNNSWHDFTATAKPFYDWLNTNSGPGHNYSFKPYMLSEFGTREDPAVPTRKGDYFRNLPAQLKALPKLKAVLYWDMPDNSGTECNWRIDTSTDSLHGFKAAGSDPYLNQAH
jgi:hypothetical protein